MRENVNFDLKMQYMLGRVIICTNILTHTWCVSEVWGISVALVNSRISKRCSAKIQGVRKKMWLVVVRKKWWQVVTGYHYNQYFCTKFVTKCELYLKKTRALQKIKLAYKRMILFFYYLKLKIQTCVRILPVLLRQDVPHSNQIRKPISAISLL